MKSLAILFLGLLVCSSSNAVTIATFADPNTVSFSFTDNGINSDGIGSLTAANSEIEVFLPELGLMFTDASFTLTDSLGGTLETTSQDDTNPVVVSTFESGLLSIKTDISEHGLNAGDVILSATFDTAIGVFGSVFSADSLTGNNVVFSGFAVQGYQSVMAEQFSFSAANITPALSLISPADMEDWTATTSFTSSADVVVPVPAAVWLMGSALIGLCGFRRK